MNKNIVASPYSERILRGGGRTNSRHMRACTHSKLLLKALSIAAVVGLNLLGLQVSAETSSNDISVPTGFAAEINNIKPSDYITKSTYGEGECVQGFKFEKDSDGNYVFVKTDENDAQVKVNYSMNNAVTTRESYTGDNSGLNIEKSFVNIVRTSGNAYGGALTNLYNSPKLGNITGDFINNTLHAGGGVGAAINNGNYGYSASTWIGDITGNFAGNYVSATNEHSFGGAICNYSTIGNVTGNFIGNTIDRPKTYAEGGAINSSVTGNITGDFIGNSAIGTTTAAGGALLVDMTTGEIKGNYIGNYAKSINSSSSGGAIYNGGTVADINGNFVANYAVANYSNSGYIGTMGGAITNNGVKAKTGVIKGNFIGNYSKNTGTSPAWGGAIYNRNNSEIASIEGDFIENYAESTVGGARGGAILNYSAKIGDISGNFIRNKVISDDGWVTGSAIYTYDGSIGNITGNFIENNAVGNTCNGGVLYNGSTIESIKGDFLRNTVNTKDYIWGGIVYNNGTINKIESSFIGNSQKSETASAPSLLVNQSEKNIGSITGDFKDNSLTAGTYAYAGAIDNRGTIQNITGNFANNTVSGGTYAYAGAIDNRGTIQNITGNFANNTVSGGTYAFAGAINNRGTIQNITGNFVNNTVSANTYAVAGAIYNTGGTIEEIHSSFKNNYVVTDSETELALGGAIYSNRTDLLFVADNEKHEFLGNYTQDKRGKINNAIFVRTNKAATDTTPEEFYSPTLTFESKNGGSFVMHDNIDGGEINSDWTELKREHHYNVNITGDGTGTMYLFNDIHNANVTFDNTTINTVNNVIHTYEFNSLALNSNTNFVADVDLQNEVMDHIETGNNYTIVDGAKLTVSGMNLLNDAKKNNTKIFFAESKLAQSVDTTVKQVAYSPIYKYDVNYIVDENDNQGYFTFARHATPKPGPEPTPGPSPDSFNPAVLSSPVVAQAGAQSAMNQALYYSFEHGDTFMNNYATERFAMINNNAYALSTDYNENGERINYNSVNKGVWVKPYAVFENIPLKNGPKVNTISYGSIIGFDSNFHKLKKGWTNVGTAYIGYNGSQIKYDGVDTTTNGGMLGVTETFYKGNFWTAITATAGAGVAEAHTMYGKDDMTSLMAGIGSKTGYNFEFANGKFIIQPRLFLAYSMIKTFDYTNSAGVRINSAPLHTIQINPAIKFIGNIKDWQPYASVGMNWNVMNQTKVSANGVRLPEMYTRPYVEYGVGLQKHWNDKYSAYGQAMVRNGGRNGIALSLGFRVTLGKEGKPIEKVQNNQTKKLGTLSDTTRTTLKQLTPTQKAKLTNSTRSSMIGIIN